MFFKKMHQLGARSCCGERRSVIYLAHSRGPATFYALLASSHNKFRADFVEELKGDLDDLLKQEHLTNYADPSSGDDWGGHFWQNLRAKF